MIEYHGHVFGRREDAEFVEAEGYLPEGYLPEGKKCLSYWGIWIVGGLTVSVLGVLGAMLSQLGY